MNTTDLPVYDTRRARVEIIPLIDVVFFLLATFVLFTLALSKITAITQNLPSSHGDTPDNPTLYLQASEGETYYWKEGRSGAAELIAGAELTPRLLDYKRRVASPRVFIRGDGKARFGPAIHALDEAHQAGIDEVGIETLTSATGS